MRKWLARIFDVLRNFEWIVSLRDWIHATAWWKGGGTVGGLTVVAKFLASDIVVAALAVITVFCFGMALITRRSKFPHQANKEAPFDVPIRDALIYLWETVPHSFNRSSLSDQAAFEILHEQMCTGKLPVVAATREFDVRRIIPSRVCRKLKPEAQVVPLNQSTPEGVRFLLMEYANPNWKASWDGVTPPVVLKQYSDLRIRSVDLYRIWPPQHGEEW